MHGVEATGQRLMLVTGPQRATSDGHGRRGHRGRADRVSGQSLAGRDRDPTGVHVQRGRGRRPSTLQSIAIDRNAEPSSALQGMVAESSNQDAKGSVCPLDTNNRRSINTPGRVWVARRGLPAAAAVRQ